ncbi:MAG TPA: porin family protein [Longimicrobiales bacterium]
MWKSRRSIAFGAALAVSALAVSASRAEAQQLEIGFKLGAAIANLTNPAEEGAPDPESITSFSGGGHLRFGLSPAFSLQPELLFVRKGAADPEQDDTDSHFDYVEIPVLARFDIPLIGSPISPFFYAGPYAAFEVACTINDQGEEQDCGDHETFDYGAVVGAGLGFAAGPGRLVAEGRYDLGLRNLTTDENDLDQKNRAIGLFVGYAVPLGL